MSPVLYIISAMVDTLTKKGKITIKSIFPDHPVLESSDESDDMVTDSDTIIDSDNTESDSDYAEIDDTYKQNRLYPDLSSLSTIYE
jgi:hypothetical protein